jgi:hypothetical protein
VGDPEEYKIWRITDSISWTLCSLEQKRINIVQNLRNTERFPSASDMW